MTSGVGVTRSRPSGLYLVAIHLLTITPRAFFHPFSFISHDFSSSYPTPTPTRYRDRQTRSIVVEHVPGQSLLRWFYSTNTGHLVFRAFLNRPLCSRFYGWWKQQHLDSASNPPFCRALPHRPRRDRISPQPLFQLQRLLSFAASSPELDAAIPTPSASVAPPMARFSSIRRSQPTTCCRSKAARSRPANS